MSRTTGFLITSSLALGLAFSASLHATIKVGEYTSLTGKEAAFGQSSHKGTALAFEEINAAGGVLGEQLELLTEDNQSKPGESVTAVKKLIARDKVVAVLGEVVSSRSLEGASVCQAFKIPMVSPFSTNPKVTERGDYIFRICFIDPFQGGLLARFAREHMKVTRAAIMTSSSSAYSVGLSKYFVEAFVKAGGTIVADQKFAEGDKDFKAQLTAIKAANPEVIVVPGYYTEAALISRQAHQLDLNVPFLGGDGWDAPELIQIGGKDVEGAFFSTHFSADDNSPAARRFIAAFEKRYGIKPDACCALGYDAAQIFFDALRRAGSTRPEALRDALAATKNFAAATGMITIDANRNASKPAVILTIKDGQQHFVESIAP